MCQVYDVFSLHVFGKLDTGIFVSLRFDNIYLNLPLFSIRDKVML